MKTLMIAAVVITLLTASAAFALEPPSSMPPKGTEGPDVRYAEMVPQHGLGWPDVRSSPRCAPPGRPCIRAGVRGVRWTPTGDAIGGPPGRYK